MKVPIVDGRLHNQWGLQTLGACLRFPAGEVSVSPSLPAVDKARIQDLIERALFYLRYTTGDPLERMRNRAREVVADYVALYASLGEKASTPLLAIRLQWTGITGSSGQRDHAIVLLWLRETVSRGFGCSTGSRGLSYSTDAHMPNWACQAPSSFDSGGRESCAVEPISPRSCGSRCSFRSPGRFRAQPLWPGLLPSRQSRISSGPSSVPSPASPRR